MKKTLTCLLVVALCAVALAAAPKEAERRTITVTGTAEVNVPPDICYLSFGCESFDKKSATVAYKANSQAMVAVAAAIKAAGIPDKDIQTTNLTMAPQYRYDEKPTRRYFDGYKVSQRVSVKVRDLSKVSAVLDAAVTAGANEVGSVSFTVENPKKYTADARVDALKAAKAKAEKICEVTGMKLGKPITVSENEPGNYRSYYAQTANAAVDFAGGDQDISSLQPGEMKLAHTVYVTYEME